MTRSILPVYMYIEAFQFNALGYGTAIALALIVIAALFSVLYVRQRAASLGTDGVSAASPERRPPSCARARAPASSSRSATRA